MLQSLQVLIRELRRDLGLTQSDLAEQVGVNRSLIANWEAGRVAVPEGRVPDLARVLRVSAGTLVELRPSPKTDQDLPRPPRRQLAAMAVKGSFDEMLELYSYAMQAYNQALRCGLTPAVQAEVNDRIPRDSSLELLGTYWLLAYELKLQFLSPLRVGCEKLVVHPGTWRYAGHIRRHAFVRQWKGGSIVAFPQVTLAAPAQNWRRRTDLLVRYMEGRRCVWGDVELDGGGDRRNPNEDARRTVGLELPRLGYATHVVNSPRFMSLLMHDLKELLKPRPKS